MTMLLTLTVTGILGCIAAWILRERAAPEKVYYLVRCGHCDQKVRYLAEKGGATSRCPRCRQCVVLPATPEPLARPRMPHRVGERLLHRAS
jgi:hypothetical protein